MKTNNTNQISISVLVPVYNVEKFIEICAGSLFRQSVTEGIEFIFVDDCSPDKSMELLYKTIEKYPWRKNQTTIIRHTENLGLGQTRNTGIKHAVGKFVYIIDSDDWLIREDALELMLNEALQTDAEIVEADYIIVKNDGEKRYQNLRDMSTKNKTVSDIIRKNASITIWNKLILRNLYNGNFIMVPQGINNGEDYITLPKLFYYAKKVSRIDCCTYAYNQLNVSSFSANKSNWSYLMDMLQANRDLYSFFKDKNAELLNDVEDMYQETKAYLLLYSTNILELNEVRKVTHPTDIWRLKNIRWKYAVVLLLDIVGLNRLILKIGKKFRQ